MNHMLLIAGIITVVLGSLTPAQAGKVGIGKAAKQPPERYVRDHRGPSGMPGGGVKVSRDCTKVKNHWCHSH
jgi:hypothetical protein